MRPWPVLTSLHSLTTALAYWIAFGPHGPRAESPKGEGWRIASKVVQLVAVSVALFYTTRLFAKPPPRTLTKEWQEASNEYARVRQDLWSSLSIALHRANTIAFFINRKRTLNLSPASAVRVMRVLVTFRAPQPNLNKFKQEGSESGQTKSDHRPFRALRQYLRYLEEVSSGRLSLCFFHCCHPTDPTHTMYCLLCYNQNISLCSLRIQQHHHQFPRIEENIKISFLYTTACLITSSARLCRRIHRKCRHDNLWIIQLIDF